MPRFNEIAERVQESFPNADLALLHKAYVYTAKVHQGQNNTLLSSRRLIQNGRPIILLKLGNRFSNIGKFFSISDFVI